MLKFTNYDNNNHWIELDAAQKALAVHLRKNLWETFRNKKFTSQHDVNFKVQAEANRLFSEAKSLSMTLQMIDEESLGLICVVNAFHHWYDVTTFGGIDVKLE